MRKNQLFPCSIYCKDESPVFVNDRMSGKMEDIPCIGTSCNTNSRCQERIRAALESGDRDCICLQCYAGKTLNRYNALELRSQENARLLNSCVIDTEFLPVFKRFVEIARFEPFGDVDSVTQCINYINICRVNPKVQFAAWTKNPDIWDEAFAQVEKPDNLIMVLSSPTLNKISECNYKWIDKIFTVWKKESDAEAAGCKINCGKNKCYDCMRCYTKSANVEYIHELKK